MAKRQLFDLFFLVALLVLFTNCASTIKPKSVKNKKSPLRILFEQNKQLREENRTLSNRLDALEDLTITNKKGYEARLRNLEVTISLLERVVRKGGALDRTKRRPRSRKRSAKNITPAASAKKKDPTKSGTTNRPPAKQSTVRDASVIQQIKTPINSPSINTISLQPSLPGTDHVRSTPKNEMLNVTPSTSTPLVAPQTHKKKNTTESVASWEDPDLAPPISPIKLHVIPGAKKLYQKAFKLYSSRKTTESIKMFQEFLNRFPNDLDADNSQYWIGRAYYHDKRLIEAETAFRKVIRNYEHKETKLGYKTPDSILMLGRIYLKRKKTIKARFYFQQVTRRFPQSRSAKKAHIELQSLNSF